MMRRLILATSAFTVLAFPVIGEASEVPQLGEHQFVPATAIEEPFLGTFVQTRVSLASTVDSYLEFYSPLDSTLIGVADVSQAYSTLGFMYQQRVRDWIVVQTKLEFLGRMGTDTSSLLAKGITGAFGYDIGWMLRLAQTRSFLMSSALSLGTTTATFIDPLNWLDSILAGERASLVIVRRSLIGSGGLRGAWALSRRFGLLGSVKLSYGESFDVRARNAWHADARLAISYDAEHDLPLPIGLALTGGRYENDVDGDLGTGTWFWNLRAGIKGRDDFSLGFQAGMAYFDLGRFSGSLKVFEGSIDMRYFY